jgi:LmbE family N-acetylglucosaminyl deacetylase
VKVLAVEAHPDDVELMCAGTLARLAERGHDIAICSVTAGEYGSKTLGPQDVRPIRIREGEASAAVLKGKFYCAEGWDKHFIFNEQVRNHLCEIFRKVAPDIVFAPSPKDYILDHDFSSLLARDCATAAVAPTFVTGIYPPSPPTPRRPYFYYCEPIYQMDIFGDPVLSSTYVDITAVMETKRRMLACHVSQFEFMPKHFGAGMEFGTLFEPWNRNNGQIAGCAYAEGFRQHVAPPFPHDNILVELIGAKHIRARGTSA